MTLLISLFLSLGALVNAEPAEFISVDNVVVEGRAFTHSCGYFSNIESNLSIRFRKDNVEPNTRVFLLYGWGGVENIHNTSFVWRETKEVEMNLLERHVWHFDLTQILSERSSPIFIKDLNFVIRINEPGKTPYYEAIPGNGIAYVAHILDSAEAPACIAPGATRPEFEPLVVQIVR